MSKDQPIDIEKQYPWGTKTKTYDLFVILFAINVILLSIMFLAYIEIPFMQGENVIDLRIILDAHAQVNDDPPEEPTDEQKTILYCFFSYCS